MTERQRILVFGASGAIGSAIAAACHTRGWDVVPVSRAGTSGIAYDPFAGGADDAFDASGPYTAVCWAQGSNASDNVRNVDLAAHLALYQANCLYVLATMKLLLARGLLAPRARLCVISSIWQNLARQDKLSYCMSKAALQGLVMSASTDLAADGILINAILPGPLDTPMTRQNLAPDQLERLAGATLFQRLPALDDVAGLACFLCSPDNTGITGQFIAADLGFSHVRLV